ncbi:MAG: phosphate acyltransferase PlsX [Rubricella sp.]
MPRDIVISIDAMGGDGGPGPIVSGMAKSARKNEEIRFILHGDEAVLSPLVARKRELDGIVEIRHAPGIISMNEKPSRALRQGRDSSMWETLHTVEKGEASVAVSCGNTGALMAMAVLRLRKAPGVSRPAIAVLWPSVNPGGYNVVLDVGADVRAEPESLLQYAIMGAEYARVGQNLDRPRVGLLNVGTEEHKGRPGLQDASALIATAARDDGFEYVGFVEGGDIASDRVDVIVTDGFTGNIALKTAEGTASLIRGLLRDAFSHTILSRIGAIFAITSLRRLSKRLDPRRVNGGVFLGLNGPVVKSHGSADATGMSAAIKLAFNMAKGGFSDQLAARIASHAPRRDDAADPAERDAE